MILLGDTTHGAMIASAAGIGFDRERDQCISRVTRDGQLLGGVVFTNYNGAAIWAHFSGVPGWATRELVWVCCDYPFMQLKVKHVLTTVSSRNTKVLAIVKRLGMKQLYSIKDAVPEGGSLVLFSLSKANCKWIKLRSRYIKANGHAETVHAHL